MTVRPLLSAALAAALLLVQSAAATAHRLDEYLQATRIGVGPASVAVEIELTPGQSIASAVIAAIDSNGDGRFSTAEAEAYGRMVVGSWTLSVDGRPVQLQYRSATAADERAMREGVGSLRIQTSALLESAAPGRHRLDFVNGHQPSGSVYLVNALVPDDPHVRITAQRRDPEQRSLSIDYEVSGSDWGRRMSYAGGLVVAAVLIAVRRKTSQG